MSSRPNKRRRSQRKNRIRPAHNCKLLAEQLEDRRLLATLTVNSVSDDTTGGDGFVTLREAIAAANGDTATDLGQTGSGADTIVFDSSIAGEQIDVSLTGDSSIGRSAFVITSPITIQGTEEVIDGTGLDTNNAANNRRAFLITAAGNLTLDNVTVQDFSHKGGNSPQGGAGGGGGGGGAGLGGGIFVDGGTLALNSVTMKNNDAVGGNGGLAFFGGTDSGSAGGGLLADAGGGAPGKPRPKRRLRCRWRWRNECLQFQRRKRWQWRVRWRSGRRRTLVATKEHRGVSLAKPAIPHPITVDPAAGAAELV